MRHECYHSRNEVRRGRMPLLLSGKCARRFSTFLSLGLLLSLAGLQILHAQTAQTPTSVITDLLDTVKHIKKAEPDKNILLSPEEEKRNAELSQKANRILDVQAISAYALWEHWDARSLQDRRAFVQLFSELLEKVAYTNTSKFLGDLEVTVHKEKTLKDKAMVSTSVVHEKEGRIDIDFKLHQGAGGSWLVEDVLLDGVSLARNLRTQCQKIIRENSFQELLARMKKKIVEKDTEDLKEITGRS